MRHGVWIRHLESSLLKVVAVVEQRPADKQGAFGINYDTNAVGLHQDVAIGRAIDKIHLILQPGTTSANDRDSECALRTALPLQQLRKLRCGASGHLHQTLIPDLVLYFTWLASPANMESAPPKSKRGLDSPKQLPSPRDLPRLKSWFGERSMPDSRRFTTELVKTLALACPIMAGQVGQMLMGLVDTLMVGHVGTTSLAAAAFANCLMSVAFVFGIGVLTSVGVLVSRAHGAGMDRHKASHPPLVNLAVRKVGVILATILTLALPWLSVFRQPEAILDQAKPFIAILSWSLVPALVFISSKTFSEAISRPLVPALIMYLGVALNVFLNWVLIFGNLGAPALGLVGAGWATLISRVLTMTGTLLFCVHVTGSDFSILLPVFA